jgi:hypothetical protein
MAIRAGEAPLGMHVVVDDVRGRHRRGVGLPVALKAGVGGLCRDSGRDASHRGRQQNKWEKRDRFYFSFGQPPEK